MKTTYQKLKINKPTYENIWLDILDIFGHEAFV